MRPCSFNTDWTCKPLGSDLPALPVRIPHDAMLAEKRSADSPGGKHIGWFAGGDYLYEKHFTPDHTWKSRAILEFEGVYRNCEVLLNGEAIGGHPYGYSNFYVDISDKVNRGVSNTVQVIARNQEQPNSRWYTGTGLYRPVVLWTADEEHILINGVQIRTVSVSPPIISVSVKTSAPGTAVIRILDGEALIAAQVCQVEAEMTASFILPFVSLWQPDAPKLYTCQVAFGSDEYTCSFGVRTIAWGPDGFLINGKRTILHGACIHHDNGLLGACAYPEAEERRVRLLKENGYNAIRSAHNPCSKALLDACDRLGMLVLDEYADQWYIHKTRYDYASDFAACWQQDLRRMVEKDFNHPSVIMYSIGNEVSETAQKKGIALTKEMTAYLHSLDASRPVTCGVNLFFNFLSTIGLGVYSDKKAAADAKRGVHKAVGSEFFNNLAGIFGSEFMKRGAQFFGCDLATRAAYDALDIAGYNYGVYRYARDLKKYPQRLILGSETFCKDAYRFRELAEKEPRLIGDFVWSGMDYLGEAGLGAWEYLDETAKQHPEGWLTSGCGRIDITGRPLGEAMYTRVALKQTESLFIAVRPVNLTFERHSPSAWKMTNAIPSWSWMGCEGRIAHVEVYARAAVVELWLNGRRVGRKRLRRDCQAHFFVRYQPGTLEARAFDARGNELGRQALTSAGAASQIIIEPEESVAHAGRLCYVRLRYGDAAGVTTPMKCGRIRVKVRGGELVALGNGCPYYPGSYLSPETDMYAGEALAILLPDGSDDVRIEAEDNQFASCIRIPVHAAGI